MSTPAEHEALLTLQQLAEACHVELTWVREVYDYGLLGEGRLHSEAQSHTISVAAAMYGRVALIRRLHQVQGVNFAGIAIILELLEPETP